MYLHATRFIAFDALSQSLNIFYDTCTFAVVAYAHPMGWCMALDKKIQSELHKVLGKVKNAQNKLHEVLSHQPVLDEARKYAKHQSKEVKKLFAGDVTKILQFVEKEKKQLERLSGSLPEEIKKVKAFVSAQKKELTALLKSMRTLKPAKKAKKKSSKKSVTKKSKKL